MSFRLSLAAGMFIDVGDPGKCVDLAAEAGFSGIGLRFLDGLPGLKVLDSVRGRLTSSGVELLDLELVQFGTGKEWSSTNAVVEKVAYELAPRYLTTVFMHDEKELAIEQLGHLAESVNPAGVIPVVEFMPFSGVKTWSMARDIVRAVGTGRAAVLVDSLHLSRSGDTAKSFEGVGAELMPFVQICDALRLPADGTRRGLLREALGERLLPCEGDLPLVDFVRALSPDTTISVEVLSDKLLTDYAPYERAVAARLATEALISLSS